MKVSNNGVHPGKIVFVSKFPFEKRDFQRLGITKFRSLGLDVELWDSSAIFYPMARELGLANDAIENQIQIRGLEHLEKLAGTLSAQDVLLFNNFGGGKQNFLSFKVYLSLARSKAALASIVYGAHPNSDGRSAWAITLQKLSALRRTVRAADFSALGRVANESLYWVFSKLVVAIRWSKIVRPLDILWCGATLRNSSIYIAPNRTKIRYVHSPDYDELFQGGEIDEILEPFWLLIDGGGPEHRDYILLEQNPFMLKEDFFDLLRKGLDRIESLSGIRVVVAAHPSVKQAADTSRYGSRPVIQFKTASLVKQCHGVLMVEASTAVSMPVVLRKPIVVMTSENLDQFIRLGGQNIIRLTGCGYLNMDRVDQIVFAPVDEKKYRAYEHAFIKKPGSLEGDLSEIIAQDIKSRLWEL